MSILSFDHCVADEKLGLASSVINFETPVACPKPRRVGVLPHNPVKLMRLHVSHHTETNDVKPGAGLLDLILMKEENEGEHFGYHVASSPPFYCGSPPTRAANPLIHDARFGDEMSPVPQFLPMPSPSGLSSPSSARKGGRARMNFGLKPAATRVEGFDCLNRDCQSSSIPAMA